MPQGRHQFTQQTLSSEREIRIEPMQMTSILRGQILLRDLVETDRPAFLRYQIDPEYRRLYDFEDGLDRPNRLFDQFVAWQRETPRLNYQFGIFDRRSNCLLGCGGLRGAGERAAIMGIEMAPSEWGRFRRAIDATMALLSFGFETLELDNIVGDTGSGNRRIEKMAGWFGAEAVARREGPEWMRSRGWCEVDWSLSKARWRETKQRLERRIPP